MLEKLKRYIEDNVLIKPTDRLLLAISGGVDSMVMLHLFQQLPYNITVAHVNFGLRAEESDADELFVRQYCENNAIPIKIKKVDTRTFKQEHKLSVQMAAREIRYQWFKELMQTEALDKLLVAHHIDDSIETTFINLIRGTGIAGLKGIVSNDIAVRPMLCFYRNEINEYALSNSLQWREDSSNQKNDYLRNKLRNVVLPMFDELSDTWRSNVFQLNKNIEESDKILSLYYNEQIGQLYNANFIKIEKLKSMEIGKWLFRKLLHSFGFTHANITDILLNIDIQKGAIFESEDVVLRKEINGFCVERKAEIFKFNKEYSINIIDKELEINGTILALEIESAADFNGKFEHFSQYLDFEKLVFPLKIRTWQAGDWFMPLGLNGKKKLSDYFVDKKFTYQQKENCLVLLSEGNIVCILGHQIDERYKLTEASNQIYKLKLKNG